METLLDAVDALAATKEPELPDLTIPEEFEHLKEPSEYLELRESVGKGKGWFASKDIPAGTRILVSKPIAMILDWENEPDEEMEHGDQDDDIMDDSEPTEEEEEPEPRINQMLLLDVLEGLQDEPDFWFQQLATLFPRNDAEVNSLPAWICPDDQMFMQVEAALAVLRKMSHFTNEVVTQISRRLPHIIRYNILSVETCPELLSYPGPGGHSSLSGVGLYYYPSFFNHSARPNCARWALGDLMFFVANQSITAGEEVCISYIEHDVLCESSYRRNRMLRMNFQDSDGTNPAQESEEGPEMPVVDPDVQNELMTMDPLERLISIDELLQQANGEKGPSGDGEEPTEMDETSEASAGWFQCDVHNLRILKAITLESLGQTAKALELWEKAVQFCHEKLPPADESSVTVRTQAALCALHAGELQRAQEHANMALRAHNLLFGGEVRLFRRRYRRDLELALRPAAAPEQLGGVSPIDVLWPLVSNAS